MFNTGAFISYVLITAFTPGPNNLMSMTNAGKLGFRKSFPFNLGILVGFLVVTSLCALFSSLLFSLIPKIELPMKILGAGYMLFLSWKTYHSASAPDADIKARGFTAGALLQFINPKIYFYCFTSMGSYILPYTRDPWLIIGFVVVLSVTGFASTVLWALFGSGFKALFSGKAPVVNWAMTLLLGYCAWSLLV